MALSLASYNPKDPSFNSWSHNLNSTNYCGFIGGFLADFLYQFFGVMAWLLVVFGLKAAWGAFHGKRVRQWALQLVWVVLLTLSVSGLVALYSKGITLYGGRILLGGLLGYAVSNGLVRVFNEAGVSILLFAVSLILLVFYTQRPLEDFLQIPGAILRHFTGAMRSLARVAFSGGIFLVKFSHQGFTKWWGQRSVRTEIRPIFVEKSFRNPMGATKSELEYDDGEEPGNESLASGAVQSAAAQKVERSCEEEDESAPSPPTQLSLLSHIGRDSTPRRRLTLKTKIRRRIENWKLPDLALLEDPPATRTRVEDRVIRQKAEILVDKLGQFAVRGVVDGIKTGPAVTLFEFKPDADIKISKITELADDLSLALSSESVRIIAPIPGRDVVGIETSNPVRETVYLKENIALDRFWSEDVKLPVALGARADGTARVVDLRKMPHLLVAGTTGSGKSVFVVSFLTGLLFKHSPKTLRLILIDPKQVDLAVFNRVPHLVMPPIREPKKAVSALRWAIREMEKRYRSMSRFSARNLEDFNKSVSELTQEECDKHRALNEEMAEANQRNEQYYYTEQPYLVIVVEEFGDLMAVDKANVEQAVVRLAQMARASGLHLVLAMQSPRKDVVTGLIKTNIPGRISFKVASKMDSRIILDEAGGERLLAQGDMLFVAPGVGKPERHHGPWLSEEEIQAVAAYWSSQGEPEYDELALRALEGTGGGFDFEEVCDEEDLSPDSEDRYDEILAYVASLKEVSASLLQRKFRLGYPRAARLIEILESQGVVGPANGSKPRQVFVNKL